MIKILLVDDDDDFLKILTYIVSKLDCKLITAGNGKDAVYIYHSLIPDIVIMDIKMPIMDGFEAAFRIKNFDSEAEIIFLTGYTELYFYLNARNLGVHRYLTKPVEENTLLYYLNKVITHQPFEPLYVPQMETA